MVLFADVEDINGNPALSGKVTFEYCGDYEPKEFCDAGLARWKRLDRISIGHATATHAAVSRTLIPVREMLVYLFWTGGTGWRVTTDFALNIPAAEVVSTTESADPQTSRGRPPREHFTREGKWLCAQSRRVPSS